jgi:hypothetical protein
VREQRPYQRVATDCNFFALSRSIRGRAGVSTASRFVLALPRRRRCIRTTKSARRPLSKALETPRPFRVARLLLFLLEARRQSADDERPAEYNKAHKDETEGQQRHLQGARNETSDRDDGGHGGARDE